MRRSALHLSGLLIGLVAFVVVSMSATAGKAADEDRRPVLPPLLMASATTPAPELLHELAAPRHAGPRTILMEVTAYCPCRKCCGRNARGITASGLRVTHNAGLFVAADTSVLPFHTRLLIPGYGEGEAVPVLDRGGAIKGNRLDVFFPSHQEAREWGRRMIEVTIVE
jgi:3D (Asp-Asp-Asp) domain-containing protein